MSGLCATDPLQCSQVAAVDLRRKEVTVGHAGDSRAMLYTLEDTEDGGACTVLQNTLQRWVESNARAHAA
jgi:hypothetical protein